MFFDTHTHTHFSNIRLIDSINTPKNLINAAIEKGLAGIAITDHECLGGHMEVNNIAREKLETNPDFKIALGNEIYLINERGPKQKYFHFILIAKDKIGHTLLNELSSTAWYNEYSDRGFDRVPTTKQELKDTIDKYGKGHLIATTACLAGELSTDVMELINSQALGKKAEIGYYANEINDFITFCKDLFSDDFYIECAPSESPEQLAVNKELRLIANKIGIKMVVGSDAHYINESDRLVHKAYLNSKDGEREVDAFYSYAHLMTEDEAKNHLLKSEGYDEDFINEMFKNSLEIKAKIENYDLRHSQKIAEVEVEQYPKKEVNTEYKFINQLFNSDNVQERYWINECYKGLEKKHVLNNVYLNEINIEAEIILHIGETLNQCLFAYFNTFKHYIDLFWECGSIIGPGRGSATGFLSNAALGITQLDPIKWDLPYWRFLNMERVELPSLSMILGNCKKRMLTTLVGVYK